MPIAKSFTIGRRARSGILEAHVSVPQTLPRERILALLREQPARTAILCDIDGTLAPWSTGPRTRPFPLPPGGAGDPQRPVWRPRRVHLGPPAKDARRMVGLDSLTYIGNHGLERLAPGADEPEVDPGVKPLGARVRAFAYTHFDDRVRAAGVRLEDKDAIWAFHWRGAHDPDAARALLDQVAAAAREAGLVPHWGRMVLEIRPTAHVDKGTAVTAALAGRTGQRRHVRRRRHHGPRRLSPRLRALRSEGALELRFASGCHHRTGPRRSPQRRTSSWAIPTSSASCSPGWRPDTRPACPTPTSSSQP